METLLALLVGALAMQVWHLMRDIKELRQRCDDLEDAVFYDEDDEEDGPNGGEKLPKVEGETVVAIGKGRKSA